ncbi:hypothetical protein [uncultured Microbacterium sp.]|uniref:hypothetical protein n=1 Tax=uncultured Microbacterium sp. TaxID=191216 RepID=UPI0026207060|nr:hypothetical protein [uncultured Microbacterium sp.]
MVAAFLENAVGAIAQRAEERERLQRMIIRDVSVANAAARAVSYVRGAAERDSLTSYVQQRKTAVAPHSRTDSVAPLADVMRIVGGRRRSFLSHRIGNATWKVNFAKSAAKKLRDASPSIIFSMPGSSLETFAANRESHKVFHAIDAHPRTRNDRLYSVFGENARGETYPQRFVERIERELALADTVLVPEAP